MLKKIQQAIAYVNGVAAGDTSYELDFTTGEVFGHAAEMYSENREEYNEICRALWEHFF